MSDFFKHTRDAYSEFLQTRPALDAALSAANNTEATLEALDAVDAAWRNVQRAVFADTHDRNCLENCLIVDEHTVKRWLA